MLRSPLVDIAAGHMPAQMLNAAAELKLADVLADGPQSHSELAVATDTHAPTLLRLLRSLVAMGVLAQTKPDQFELTELGDHLRTDAPDSVRDVVRYFCAEWVWSAWGAFMHSLRTGEVAFEHLYGMQGFEFLARNPDQAAKFNSAMGQLTQETAADIIAGCDFSGYRTVIDVGGGNGTLIAEILCSTSGLKGVVYDMPSGIGGAHSVFEAAGVTGRATAVGGDFFESVPVGDAYIMKYILHDWDDERALKILCNIRRSISGTGRLIIFERVIPEMITPDQRRALLSDLFMLVLPGGRERTEAEYRALLAAAGFHLDSVIGPLGHLGFSRLEAVPT